MRHNGKFVTWFVIFSFFFISSGYCENKLPPSLKEMLVQKYAKPFQSLDFEKIQELKHFWIEFKQSASAHAMDPKSKFDPSMFYNAVKSEKYDLPKSTYQLFHPLDSKIPFDLQEEIVLEALFPKMVRAATDAPGSVKNACILINSQLWCYGDNWYGQIGNGHANPLEFHSTPSRTIKLSSLRDVAMSGGHVLGITQDGKLWSWGAAHAGQLGQIDSKELCTGIPGVVGFDQSARKRRFEECKDSNFTPADSRTVQVSASYNHSLALLADGSVWGWGTNLSHQLGVEKGDYRLTPMRINFEQKVKFIASGGSRNFAITDQDEVWAWGSGSIGSPSYLSKSSKLRPFKKVAHIPGVIQLALEGMDSWDQGFVLALDQNGKVWTWKDVDLDVLSSNGDESIPEVVDGLPEITAIFAGGSLALALDKEGQVWGWGYWKRYFDPTKEDQTPTGPVQIPNLVNVRQIEANDDYATVLTRDGKVWRYETERSSKCKARAWLIVD
jgi:alpha-tubulin suppressor-like RCC1 family protein